MTRIFVSLLCALLLASQTGCLRGPVGWQRVSLNQRISAEDVRFIIDGQTSLPDVTARLGSPDEMLAAGDHVLAREHERERVLTLTDTQAERRDEEPGWMVPDH